MNRIVAFLACLLFGQVALADGYEKFYTPNPNATPAQVAKIRVNPAPETPQLAQFSDSPQAIIEAYVRQGYFPIGYSNFTSGWAAKSKNAVKQGKRVGADLVVVVNPTLTSSVTTAFPLTTPTTQTTYHTGQATAYGPGGTVNAYGSGTSTTYGSKTTYIPYTVNRYEYGAIYFVKRKFLLGVLGRSLNDTERQRLQSNSGLVVQTVPEGTPAFVNDILPGDILLRINGHPVAGEEAFSNLVEQFAGTRVELSIDRNGQQITKSVQLLP